MRRVSSLILLSPRKRPDDCSSDVRAEPTAVSPRRIFADESSRRALGGLGRAGAGRIVLFGAVALAAERRTGGLRSHRRGGLARRAGVPLGAQGLRAGALAAGPDPHRLEGPRQPDLGRLGLSR